ncbi:MAG TPA: tyrosine-type recombinase/integrase [Streptosporangiaceae bacterium]|nr:tyrosine-type recombinase/integrase [Streptosporangiaceae bacterium]
MFTGVKGGPLRRSNFNKMSAWPHAVRAVGAEGLHFHDLRHTGNHLAAVSGAGLRDLMARMGHDSERAAIIYQHPGSRCRRADHDRDRRAHPGRAVIPCWSRPRRRRGHPHRWLIAR